MTQDDLNKNSSEPSPVTPEAKTTSPIKRKKPKAKESSDEDLDGRYSLHDMSDEMHFSSEDEMFLEHYSKEKQLEKPGYSGALPKKIVQLQDLNLDSFVVVEVLYDKGTKKERVKKFIDKVLSVKNSDVEVKFFRRSTKAMYVYTFPEIDDIMTVDYSQIMEEAKSINVSRGTYIFPYEMDFNSFNSMCRYCG